MALHTSGNRMHSVAQVTQRHAFDPHGCEPTKAPWFNFTRCLAWEKPESNHLPEKTHVGKAWLPATQTKKSEWWDESYATLTGVLQMYCPKTPETSSKHSKHMQTWVSDSTEFLALQTFRPRHLWPKSLTIPLWLQHVNPGWQSQETCHTFYMGVFPLAADQCWELSGIPCSLHEKQSIQNCWD